MQFNRPIIADNLLLFREYICFIDLFLDKPGLAGLPLLSFFHFFSKGTFGDKWHRLQWAGCPFCTPATCQTTEHTQPFYGAFSSTTWWTGVRRDLLDFVVPGKISEADTLTIRLGATPSGLISYPPRSSPIFMRYALRAATLPIYPGLGQTPNMLACILSGLSKHWREH